MYIYKTYIQISIDKILRVKSYEGNKVTPRVSNFVNKAPLVCVCVDIHANACVYISLLHPHTPP